MRGALMMLALLIAIDAVALALMDHPFTYRCGHVSLWAGNIASNENSQQIADPYSFTHITHGCCCSQRHSHFAAVSRCHRGLCSLRRSKLPGRSSRTRR